MATRAPDLNVADVPLCPHCQEPVDTGSIYGHYMPMAKAQQRGLALCRKAMTWVAFGDEWGWACADGHQCHLCVTPTPSQLKGSAQ